MQDPSVLHERPNRVQMIDSTHQGTDDGMRKLVRISYFVILAKAAANRRDWRHRPCPASPPADQPEYLHQLPLGFAAELVLLSLSH
jgi:hypothetical protein